MAPSGGRTPQPGVGVTARLEAWGQEECDKCPRPLGRFRVLTVEPELSIKDQDRKKHHGWRKPGGGQSLNVLDKKQKLRKPPRRPAQRSTGWGRRRTHPCTCLRRAGPGRCRRSPAHSARSERPSCCAGSAGSGPTGGRSCPRRWGPRSRCNGTAGRAGGPQRAPVGPQRSRHHRSRSDALGKGGDAA